MLKNKKESSMAPQVGANETEIGNAKDTATEIINEQQNAAQVNNNESKSTQMEEINNQSSIAPQAGANETTLSSRTEDVAVSIKDIKEMWNNITKLDLNYNYDACDYTYLRHSYDDTFIEIDVQTEENEVYKKLKELKDIDSKILFSEDPEFFTGGITEGGMKMREYNKPSNKIFFGSEIDLENPRTSKKMDYWCVDMLPKTVWYVSVYDFDPNAPRYSILNSLPKALLSYRRPDGSIHAKLTLEYPFDYEYSTMIDFKTVNDVLTEIKRGFWIMYATFGNDIPDDYAYQLYGSCCHDIIDLRVEKLHFIRGKNEIVVSIGS